jgi:Tol biopolymer transport system component
MKPSSFALSCITLLLAAPILAHAAIPFDPLRLVSAVDPAVEPWATPNGDSFGTQLAPDGAWVLFVSDASNITTNLHQDYTLDLYLYERTHQKTTLISVDPVGARGGDAHTAVGHATPDGRLVVFEIEASNLVSGVDANSSSDVFVRDVTAGTTRLVSMNWQGTESGLGGSVDPFITPDGRYVAFASTAEDLVEGDSNGLADVFVRDLLEDSTELISVGSASPIFDPDDFHGSGGPRLSADGRWVAFSSTATNMVPGVTNLHGEIYLRDRSQGTTICPSQVAFDQWAFPEEAPPFRRRAFSPSLSEDGGYLVFIAEYLFGHPTFFTAARSLWRFETTSGEATLITTNVTWGISMEQTIYTMSTDGRFLVFTSFATDLVAGDHNSRIDIFLTTLHPNPFADTDGDGMADDWETNYFGDLEALPEVDSDLDGHPNLAEYIAATDPVDRFSYLRAEIAADTSDKVRLHWAAAPGRTYVVESRLDLVSGEWTATPGVVRIAGALAQFEAVESREAPTYYRLQIANDTGP